MRSVYQIKAHAVIYAKAFKQEVDVLWAQVVGLMFIGSANSSVTVKPPVIHSSLSLAVIFPSVCAGIKTAGPQMASPQRSPHAHVLQTWTV